MRLKQKNSTVRRLLDTSGSEMRRARLRLIQQQQEQEEIEWRIGIVIYLEQQQKRMTLITFGGNL